MRIVSVCRSALSCFFGTGLLLLTIGAMADEPVATGVTSTEGQKPLVANQHSQIFAIINGRAIPTEEYEAAFAGMIRQRFYHGQVPEGELAAAREEVKGKLVQRIALLGEAKRRGLLPDEKVIQVELDTYEKRYANRPEWQANRERLISDLRLQLEEQNLVYQLDQQVRNLPEPTEDEVRAFYIEKPELFTEPEKLRLSVILLKVDPSSPATAWEGTRQEAAAIHQRLLGGADFSEAARLHSAAYADAGGDMGYLHQGMLPEPIQNKIDGFKIGAVNEPVEMLEGMALFRLDERVPAKKREFADVAARAKELLVRERQDNAWKALVAQLVAKADVKYLHGPSAGPVSGAKN